MALGHQSFQYHHVVEVDLLLAIDLHQPVIFIVQLRDEVVLLVEALLI